METISGLPLERNAGAYSPSTDVYSLSLPERDIKNVIIKLEDVSRESMGKLRTLATAAYFCDLSFQENLERDCLRELSLNPLIKLLDLEETYVVISIVVKFREGTHAFRIRFSS